MKIKITSDGNGYNTHVVNVETGEELEDVVAVRWSVGAGGLAKASIEFIDVAAEIKADIP